MRPWVLQNLVASPEYSEQIKDTIRLELPTLDQTEERHQGAALIITERLSAWSRE